MGAWAAAIGGLIAGGSSIYGGSKANDTAKSAKSAARDSAKAMERIRDNLVGGNLFGRSTESFTGVKPEHEAFEPVDLTAEQLAAIGGNQEILDESGNLAINASLINSLADSMRFEGLVPGGLTALRALGDRASMLSQGFLPFDDVLDITRNRAETAQALGLNGTQMGGALPRDLGLSRLQAIQAGGNLLSQTAATAGQINPISAQVRAQDFFLDPAFRANVGLQQAILDQNSRQAGASLAAAPDPVSQALMGLEMQRLQMYSSGQLAAASIPQGTGYAQMGQGMAQIGSAIGQGVQAYQNRNTVQYNPNVPVVQATVVR